MIIAPDDILWAYLKLDETKRSAVTNLINAASYILMTFQDESSDSSEGKEIVLADWMANAPASMHLILGMIGIGRNEFGRLWLNELQNKISQMT